MIDVDVWVRGTNHAETEHLKGLPADPATWTEADVRVLLTEMLLALERHKNPGGLPPSVSLRGFSWIVSSDGPGVLLHLEMQTGTVSGGPFAVAEAQLSELITRVLAHPDPMATPPDARVH